MAANKFATMLSRRTNRITLVLVYAVLEWTLISLLLLNSLLSYLITKFANYFGLKNPCFFCSRLEPRNPDSFYADLLCEQHATEISKLGYCSSHRKLVESQNMCEDCLSSTHHNHQKITSMNDIRCSCCDEIITHKFLFSDVLDTENLVSESRVDDEDVESEEDHDHVLVFSPGNLDRKREENSEGFPFSGDKFSGYQILEAGDDKAHEAEIEPLLQDDATAVCAKDPSPEAEIPPTDVDALLQHLEFYIDHDDYRLIPVELVDAVENPVGEEGDHRDLDQEKPNSQAEAKGKAELAFQSDLEAVIHEEIGSELLGSVKVDDNFGISEDQQQEEEVGEALAAENIPFTADNPQQTVESTAVTALDSAPEITLNSKGEDAEREEVALEIVDQVQVEEVASAGDVLSEVPAESNHDSKSIEEGSEEGEVLSVEIIERGLNHSNSALSSELNEGEENKEAEAEESFDGSIDQPKEVASTESNDSKALEGLSVEMLERGVNHINTILSSELNEGVEEKIPDTPTSVDNLHQESLDGSIVSEVEGGDGVRTIDQLKSALKAERKALHTLYSELEEERNAAAVAANQTMAMINRLQEEKAAMQMEALHYQRMMEEQAEYDQEALQMLNEVIVKRETEKQELEKELDMYRKKVIDYEEKERLRILSRRRDSRTSSASCSNGDESDGISIDLSSEPKEEDASCNHEANGHHDDTPVEAVLNLQDSIAGFEDERISILQELKALEEKLFNLSTEEKPIEKLYEENGVENGFPNTNGKHHQDKGTNGSMQKQLLPLFDATESEFEDVEKKRVAIEDEMDHVYERVQALEADRDFLKNCIGSLRKGDRGIDLLQEILQHLRDLKNVELQARSFSDAL